MNPSHARSSPNRLRPQGTPGVQRVSSATTIELISVQFEIQGKVQGVHFRRYTQEKAKNLGLKGWVQNTYYGTVIGAIEGDRLKIDMMKDWLRRTGSPKSEITGAEFKKPRTISKYTYQEFKIIK